MINDLMLCRPTGPCDKRNGCIRYRAERDGSARELDFTADQFGDHRCMGFLGIYDTDRLMPEDWQE